MPSRPDPANDTPARWAVAVVVVAALCCVGPTLLVALGLGASGAAIGAVLAKPIVFVPAAVVLAAALAVVMRRRRRR